MHRFFFAGLLLALAPVNAEQASCPATEFVPSVNPTESRFLAAPLKRVREVVADSMQAIGVLIYGETDALVRGERRPARVSDMHLPSGNEAVYSYLEPGEQNGVRGVLVRVETRRPGSKGGIPKQSWSAAVLSEADCLLNLLSVEDPNARAAAPANRPPSAGREVSVPVGTPVTLLFRRFLFSTDLRVNQRLIFEVASNVKVGEDVVFPRGSLAVARITSAVDKTTGLLGRGAKATMSVDYVSAAGGERVPTNTAQVVSGGRRVVAARLMWDVWNDGWISGKSFGLRAGTAMDVTTEKNEVVRLADGTR